MIMTPFKTPFLVAALAVTSATGCANTPAPREEKAAACSISLTKAVAWVNRMPGPGASAKLIVVVEAENAPAELMLEKDEQSDGSTLILNVTDDGDDAATDPGRLRYEAPAGAAAPEAIKIYCAGEKIAEIADIQTVY